MKKATIIVTALAIHLSLFGHVVPMFPKANASESAADDSVQTSLGERMYTKARWIFDHAVTVQYHHLHDSASEQVQITDGNTCNSVNDCSGFVDYILHSVAPAHYEAILEYSGRRSHPHADTYAKFFDSLSTDRPTQGWLKVSSARDLIRGDIIAWENPSKEEGLPHINTGHVMIVVDPPKKFERATVGGAVISYIPVYVIDSSSVDHFPPESLPPLAHQSHRDGVGMGVVRIIVDDQGRAIAYWEGTYWGEGNKNITKPKYADMIRFGRPVPKIARG
jgi:hypothetical protein